MLNNLFFFLKKKSCRLGNNMKNYCKAGHTTDDNMAHAHFTLDT